MNVFRLKDDILVDKIHSNVPAINAAFKEAHISIFSQLLNSRSSFTVYKTLLEIGEHHSESLLSMLSTMKVFKCWTTSDYSGSDCGLVRPTISIRTLSTGDFRHSR
jgi:hypothetical protein